jgi:hypothetical protein
MPGLLRLPILALAATAFLASCGFDPSQEPCEVLTSDEVYEIYSVGLKEELLAGGGGVILREETLIHEELEGMTETMDSSVVGGAIDDRIVDEMLQDSDSAYALDPERLEWGDTRVHLLPKISVPRRVPRDDLVWFYLLNQYPSETSNFVLELSPVGSCHGDALIYAILQCGDFCSRAVYIVVVKDGDHWRFQAQADAWTS